MALLSYVGCSCVLFLVILNSYGALAANQPPPRKMVAVEGVVYSKSCGRDPNGGIHTVYRLAPFPGVEVKLQCNNTAKGLVLQVKTGGDGGFLMKPTAVSTWGVHKCKLFLVSSPNDQYFLPHYDGPWKTGYPLIAANTTATADLQYFTAAQLLHFDDMLC